MAIVLETVSDSRQAHNDLAKLKASVDNIQASVEKSTNAFANMAKTVATGFALLSTASGYFKLSDELTQMETRLRLVTDSQEAFNKALKETRNIAMSTRTSLSSVTALYSKVARSGKELGASQAQIAQLTSLITKSIAISGSGLQEANAAVLQLGQGLASGKLAGDELRSVLENAPELAAAIAKGLGVSVGKLRDLGEAGELTSVKVFKAILSQQDQINKNFGKIKITFGAAFLNLQQSLVILFSEISKSILGGTGDFATSINDLAMAIYDFAANFRLNILKARVAFTNFIVDALFLLMDFWDSLDQTASNISALGESVYQEWKPTLAKILSDLKTWGVSVTAFIAATFVGILAVFERSNFGSNVLSIVKTSFAGLISFLSQIFDAIVIKLPEVNVKEFFPDLRGSLKTVQSWAATVEFSFISLYRKLTHNWLPNIVNSVAKWFSQFNIDPIAQLTNFTTKASDAIRTFVNFLKNLFSGLSVQLPTIDVSKFFPHLDKALAIISNWVQAAERWFFWLYDKVIGNSWIPDLVTQAAQWLAQLNKKPLSLVQVFVQLANKAFSGLKFTAPIAAGIGMLLRYRSILLGIVGIAGSLALVLGGLGLASKKGFIQLEQPKSKVEEYSKKSLSWLQKIFSETKDNFDKSAVGRTLKQIFGIADRTPGQIFGEQIDTREGAYVGRGPYRMYPRAERGVAHDLMNALPKDWQMPFIVTATGLFAVAIMKAFEAGTTRSVLLSVLTTGAGIFAARTLDPAVMNKSFGAAAFKFVDIVEKGITALFSGNVLKDPLGVLSIITKTSLLFKEGREAIGKAALSIATSPTKAAETLSQVLKQKLITKDLAETNDALRSLPKNVRQTVTTNAALLNRAVNVLASTRDASGATLGQTKAQEFLQTRDYSKLTTLQSKLAAQQVAFASSNLEQANRTLQNVRAQQQELGKSKKATEEALKVVNEDLKKRSDDFLNGFRGLVSGTGGLLGGLAGLQVGTEIARGMTDSPEWVRVGVSIGGGLVGQFIGSSVGLFLSQAIISGFSFGTRALTTAFSAISNTLALPFIRPFVTAFVVFLAGLAVILDWDRLREIFTAGTRLLTLFWESTLKPGLEKFWKETVIPAFDKFIIDLGNVVKKAREETGKQLDQPVAAVGNTEVTAREGLVGGATVGIVGTGAVLAQRFFGIFNPILNSLSTSFAPAANSLSNLLRPIQNQLVLLQQVGIPLVLENFRQLMMNIQRAIPSLGTVWQAVSTSFSIALVNLRAALPSSFGIIATGLTAVFGAVVAAVSFKAAVTAAALAGAGYLVYKALEWASEALFPKASPSVQPTPITIPIQKAMGGWIRGPGTDTSDSIPALLSNGEFVVNARDAKKNWAILTAINSGQELKRFSDGTQVAGAGRGFVNSQAIWGAGGGRGFVNPTPIQDASEELNKVIKSLTESFGKVKDSLSGFLSKIPGMEGLLSAPKTKPGAAGDVPKKTFADSVDAAKNIKDAVDLLNKKLSSDAFGFKNLDVKALQAQTPEVIQSIAKIASDIDQRNAELQKRFAQGLSKSSIAAKTIQGTIDRDRAALYELLSEYNIGVEKPGGLKQSTDAEEGKKPTALTLGDQFNIVSRSFPKLGLALEEFQGLSDSTREYLFANALKFTRALKTLDEQKIGILEKGDTTNLFGMQAAYTNVQDGIELFQKEAETNIKSFRSAFKGLENSFKEIGVNLAESALNNLDLAQQATLVTLRDKALSALKVKSLPVGQTTPEATKAAEETFIKTVKEINNMLTGAATLGLSAYEKTKIKATEVGVNLDERVFNLLTDIERKIVEGFIESIKKNKVIEGMSEAERIKAQKAIDAQVAEFTKFLQKKSPDYKTQGQMAGESLADSLKQGVTSALSDLLKGKKSFSDVVKGFADTFTNAVVDAFIKGLVESFMGKDSNLMQAITSFGKDVFGYGKNESPANTPLTEPPTSIMGWLTGKGSKIWSTGERAATGLTEPPGTPAEPVGFMEGMVTKFEKAWDTLDFSELFKKFTGAFEGINFGSMFDGIVSALSTVGSKITTFIGGFFGFAAGGRVSGKGTGTSDSIPAMLSNGEFVVNAKATAENIKLLTAINNGRFRKFAEGGLVSAAMIATPVMADVQPSTSTRGNSQQVFNISITGDISRQTRAEIYGMLPSIAEGVNSHNRERGYRG